VGTQLSCFQITASLLLLGAVGLSSSPAGAITAAGVHACARTPAGGAQCWGGNDEGQLGDGTTLRSSLPVSVSGLATGVAQVSAGGDNTFATRHTCALTTVGGVLCWGSNFRGQLGDGTTVDSSVPVPVSGLTSGIAAIDAGGRDHSCALTTTGGVLCWGGNGFGQLGDGTTVDSSVPVPVSGLDSGVAAIAVGQLHTCAALTAGGAMCWGNNGDGRLGIGGAGGSFSTPVAVFGLSSGVGAIAAGNTHTCAVTTAGAALCWGDNFHGQLGDGTTVDSPLPVAVSGLGSGVAAIDTSLESHSCAMTTTGAVLCWGRNAGGALGDGTTVSSSVPVSVVGLSTGVAAIAAGGFYTCARTTAGPILCWGVNTDGQLGDGSIIASSVPISVSGLASGVAAVSAGGNHSCALTTAGGVLCWGSNFRGELGDGTTDDSSVPTPVSGLSSGVAAVTTGRDYTCALTTVGGALCWGMNFTAGQLGDGTMLNSSVPVAVSGLASGVASIAAGYDHTCALTTVGGVLCWGSSPGNGSASDSSVPIPVSGLASGVAAIAAGFGHTCALSSVGGVLCWGSDGTFVPVPVVGLTSGVTAIAAEGSGHTCALNAAGELLCWGFNFRGQLGDGTTLDSGVPVPVVGLSSGVAAVDAGGDHTCAVTAAGTALCWGLNGDGALGDGTTLDSTIPVSVLTSDLATIDASTTYFGGHTCAVTTAGGALCWGTNESGQLGDASAVPISTVPILVRLQLDEDGDGVPNDLDRCPASDLSATLVIDSCDSGVNNVLFEDGCTIADGIAACTVGAPNHGAFVSCVADSANVLKSTGIISGMEAGRIRSCAALADVPNG
jgi:alpha-tubulin suppressor-like RCC1 family protein